MRARAPGSAANLGPGFDALAVAVTLHAEVEVRPAAHLSVRIEGEGETADLPSDAGNLAARAAIAAAGHDRMEIVVRSAIPLGRGLGSSAAVAVAAAAAAGAGDPLAVAAALDGHVENAAASVLGGFVCGALVDGRPVAMRLPLDPGLSFVVLVPDRQLATAEARAVLRREVSLEDATFNLGRMGLLIAGLGGSGPLTAAATGDHLHQDARAALFAEAPELMARLVRGGALASCWSGAGSSLLGICRRGDEPAVASAGEEALGSCGVAGRVLTLAPDLDGLQVRPD